MSGNPVHFGHIAVAEAVKNAIGLDEVWLMITPYNTIVNKEYAEFHHRFTMARMIAKESGHLGDWLWVSDFEFNLQPPSGIPQSIDMLRAFEHAYPEWQPVWIMGEDNLENFHHWFAWEEILKKYPVVLVSREGTFKPEMHPSVHASIGSRTLPPKAFHCKAGEVCIIDKSISANSSTLIREQLKQRIIPEGIPASVIQYIEKHSLYGV